MKDTEMFSIIDLEQERQKNNVELIASENFVSAEVKAAQVPVLQINMQKDILVNVIMVVVSM